MYVTEVIPLSTLPPNVPQVLSYYHDSFLQKGAVVEVLVNNRKVTAVVIGSTEIGKHKILLKKSSFELKKISRVLSSEPQVSDFQFKIALWLAHEYVSPLGLTLKHVLPPFFLKKKYPLWKGHPSTVGRVPLPTANTRPLMILSRAKDSHKVLTPHVEKSTGQVLIIVPEATYIPYFEKYFTSAHIVTSATSNKNHYTSWVSAENNTGRIFIGTRQALFLPFSNLEKLIVIDPQHEFYKSDMSPKYHAANLAKMVADLYGAQLITVSNMLGMIRSQTVADQEAKLQDTIEAWKSKLEIVDLVAEQKLGYMGIFATRVKESIRESLESEQKVLVFSARRGYQGIIVCQNCGFTFKCAQCNTPLRVHQGTDLVLMCHRDSTTQQYPRFCSNCHSSNIKAVGPVGSQKIYEDLRRMMEHGQIPRVPAFILDTDVTQNQTEEDEVMNELQKNRTAILVATQKVFSYIYDHNFDYVVIPQFDSLVSSADYQTTERLWYQLEKLVDFDPKKMSIQSYHRPASASPQRDGQEDLQKIAGHNYEELYERELENRKIFGYPPFSKIVKLAYSHKNLTKVKQEGRLIVEKLKMAAIHLRASEFVKISETSPLFLGKDRGNYTYTIVIKVLGTSPKLGEGGPNSFSLRELLRFVPSSWLIDVDPRSIL